MIWLAAVICVWDTAHETHTYGAAYPQSGEIRPHNLYVHILGQKNTPMQRTKSLHHITMGGKANITLSDGNANTMLSSAAAIAQVQEKIAYTSRFVRVILAQGPC